MLTIPGEAITMLRRMDIGKVLVPVSGNHVDAEVIRIACDLAAENSAAVHAVYVLEIERSLPLEVSSEQQTARAEEILGRAQSLARERGYEIETGILLAREAGPAIVHEATEGRADLIVIGVGPRRRPGAFEFGDTVSHVLRDAPCNVLLFRAASAAEEPE